VTAEPGGLSLNRAWTPAIAPWRSNMEPLVFPSPNDAQAVRNAMQLMNQDGMVLLTIIPAPQKPRGTSVNVAA
jgi:hypothetical protein